MTRLEWLTARGYQVNSRHWIDWTYTVALGSRHVIEPWMVGIEANAVASGCDGESGQCSAEITIEFDFGPTDNVEVDPVTGVPI
jgi:maltoporin